MSKSTSVLFFISICAVLVFSCGCQEQNSFDKKRMQLVADENIKLKKQIDNCMQLVGSLNESLQQCEADKIEERQKSEESISFLMKLPAEYANENQRLAEENAQLKETIQQLTSEAIDQKQPN